MGEDLEDPCGIAGRHVLECLLAFFTGTEPQLPPGVTVLKQTWVADFEQFLAMP